MGQTGLFLHDISCLISRLAQLGRSFFAHHSLMQPPDSPQARLIDTYAFPGFRPMSRVGRLPNDPQARVVTLVRRSKNDLR